MSLFWLIDGNCVSEYSYTSCSFEMKACLLACNGVLYERKVSRGMFYQDTYDVLEELDDGGLRYMVNGHYTPVAEEATDFHAILNNYVSVGVVNNVGY